MKKLLILSSLLMCLGCLFAQDTLPDTVFHQNTLTQFDAAETGPVEVPPASEKALQYYRSGNRLWIFSTVWGWLIPGLILFLGFSAKIRDFVGRFSQRRFVQIALYFLVFLLITYVIDFALSYYSGYVRPHAYELSNQSFGKWLGDSLKSLAISAVFGSFLIVIPYWLLRRFPKRWWLYFGLGSIPFLFLMIMIQPIFIAPLFNDFGEMKNKALEAKILTLAERAGIEGSRVYEVNKSVDTKAVNAYVTGFGNTKRIVLWDTIIDKLDEEELLFVMGHEMGHYKLRHVISSILFFSLIILVALFGIHKTAGFLIERFQDRFGFTELHDIASLPLIILLFSLFTFMIQPITQTYSRHHEHESDRFGLEITQKNRPAASAFVKLQQENLGNPYPGFLVKLWRATHPPLGERIEFCNTYRPWETGEPLKYEHLFKEKP